MNIRSTILKTTLFVGLTVTTSLAHHSVKAEFDSSKMTTITGVVTRIEWTNPHVWIHMNVKGADGRIVPWRVEMAAPGALMKANFDRGFLDLTSSFTVEVWPAFQDSPDHKTGNARLLTIPDGRTFDVSDKWPDTRAVR